MAARKGLEILCAKMGKGAKLTTSAGVVDQFTPLEVPKAEAARYIKRGIAKPARAADPDDNADD